MLLRKAYRGCISSTFALKQHMRSLHYMKLMQFEGPLCPTCWTLLQNSSGERSFNSWPALTNWHSDTRELHD